MKMFEELKKLLLQVLGKQDMDVSLNTKIDDLGLNSLGKIQLVCAIEEKYDIEIPNSKLRSFKIVKNIVDFMEEIVKK